MKIKGISVIEQHVEKGIFAIAVIGLIAVAGWQVVSHPNRVNVAGREVDPGEVDSILKQRADELNAKLREDAAPQVDAFNQTPPLVLDKVETALSGSVAPRDTLARLEPELGKTLLPIDLGADTWYYEPKIPRPRMIAEVTQTADALADGVLAQFPALAERFPDPNGPLDITWTTPAAVIDLAALRDELRRSVPGAKPPRQQLPTPWYNDSIYIVDVVFQREERQPDGSWGGLTDVKTIPGQTTFRDRLTDVLDANLRNDVFAALSNAATEQELLQPEFLPTRNGAFTAPREADPSMATDPTMDEVAQLKQQLERQRAERARLWDKLETLGGPATEVPKDKGGAAGGGREGGGAGGSGPGGGRGAGGGKGGEPPIAPPSGGGLSGGFKGGAGGKGTGGADDEKTLKRRIQMTKQVAEADRRITRLEADLEKLAPGAASGAAAAVKTIDLNADDTVLTWAHDIDVKPGKVYRYRAVVKAYNPFFARKRQLVKEQHPLADRFVQASAESDWSAPVEVTPPVAFFLVRAEPGSGPLSLGSAVFEVYRLYNGRWSREQVSVGPGDRIGRSAEASRGTGEAAAVDFNTDWFVVDVADDPAFDRSGAGAQRSGIVVIQQIGTGQRLELRDPQEDQDRPDRKRLYGDWRINSAAS